MTLADKEQESGNLVTLSLSEFKELIVKNFFPEKVCWRIGWAGAGRGRWLVGWAG